MERAGAYNKIAQNNRPPSLEEGGIAHNHLEIQITYVGLKTAEKSNFWDRNIAGCKTCQTTLGQAATEAGVVHNEFSGR